VWTSRAEFTRITRRKLSSAYHGSRELVKDSEGMADHSGDGSVTGYKRVYHS